MTRREAVIKMATLMGATVVGPRLLAASFSSASPVGDGPNDFSADDIKLLDEIGDTIIPTTDVPGAKATNIGAFMAMMVRDCYVPRDQAAFKAGLQKISSTYATRFGGTFLTGKPADRTTFLNELDLEQKRARAGADAADAPHYFRVMKELTILGYFSSEIGCMQALRFTEVPGRYDGNAPYKKGEHGWFSS